ncbi:MAG: PAS domain S-box protein [Candidatus Lindowbacteria bacterium]|nr:PAS domain S-box protein [Candidatus Lindowbacteria bacterium]
MKFFRFTIGVKLAVIVLTGMVGMGVVGGFSVYSSAQLETKESDLTKLSSQAAIGDELAKDLESATYALDKILFQDRQDLISPLLVQNENLLALFSKFKGNAELLGFDNDYFFALENEPTLLEIRTDFYRCISLYRKGKITEARQRSSKIVNTRLRSLLGFILEAEELRSLEIADLKSEIEQDRKGNQNTQLVIIIVTVCITFAFTALIAQSITVPVRRLTAVAREISQKGALSKKIEIISNDEIGDLARSFEKMTYDLRVSRDEIVSAFDHVENIIRSLPDVLFVLSARGVIDTANGPASRLLGYSRDELVGMGIEQILAEEGNEEVGIDVLIEMVETGKLSNQEVVFISKKGHRIPMSLSGGTNCDTSGMLESIIFVARDMRESRKLLTEAATAEAQKERADELSEALNSLEEAQAQLVQTGKMSTMGEIGGWVAHELNTPIGAIMNFCDVAMNEVDTESKAYYRFDRIRAAAVRSAKTIEGLLGFSRESTGKMEPVNLNESIEEITSLIRSQMAKDGVTMLTTFDPDLPCVMADANQIQLVFLNMMTNARHALKGRFDSNLEIITRTEKGFVEAIFNDNGIGISEDNQKKVFTPFFTTKPKGEGTGLGLSISADMVKKHKGEIRFESVEGKGTKFVIRLPIADEAVQCCG